MLLQFKFKNHKCFYDENVLDLTATQEKRHLETTIEVNGNRILPVIEIHGANASGKSSLLEALNFMFSFIRKSSRADVNRSIRTKPFAFSDKTLKMDSEYEISLCLGEYEYRYGFSVNRNAFTEEWLYKKKFSNSSRVVQKVIFERVNNDVEFGPSYDNYRKTWDLFGHSLNNNTDKLLILSTAAIKEQTGELRDIYDYICKSNYRINNFFDEDTSIDILTQNDIVYDKFQQVMRDIDPCLLGVKIEKVDEDSDDESYTISGIHRNLENPKETILLPFGHESAGTMKIFNILPKILWNLELGGLLCIDELDIQFHPFLFKRIVNMYKDKEINKNNAQLIYTSHSTMLFNNKDNRRDQLYLVEKDELGKSKLYSLSEFKNVRIDTDYEKNYFAGNFGAVPFIKK